MTNSNDRWAPSLPDANPPGVKKNALEDFCKGLDQFGKALTGLGCLIMLGFLLLFFGGCLAAFVVSAVK